MKSGRLLKSFITLVIGFAVTVSSPAYSQAVVEVPGTSHLAPEIVPGAAE